MRNRAGFDPKAREECRNARGLKGWAWVFVLLLGWTGLASAASVGIVQVLVNDSGNGAGANVNGLADPGETVLLSLEIRNDTGTGWMQSTGSVIVSDGGVELASGVLNFPALPAGASGTSLNSLSLPLSQKLSAGTRLSIALTLTDGMSLIGHAWEPLLVGRFTSGLIYENSVEVGEEGSYDESLLPRGDGFALFYDAQVGDQHELHYQPLGRYGEPGPVLSFGPLGDGPEGESSPDNHSFAVAPSQPGYVMVYAPPGAGNITQPLRLWHIGPLGQSIFGPESLDLRGDHLTLTRRGDVDEAPDPNSLSEYAFVFRSSVNQHLILVRLQVLAGTLNVMPGLDLSSGLPDVSDRRPRIVWVAENEPEGVPEHYLVVWESQLFNFSGPHQGLLYSRVSAQDGTYLNGPGGPEIRRELRPVDLDGNLSTNEGGGWFSSVAKTDDSLFVAWSDTRHSFGGCYPGELSTTLMSCHGTVYGRLVPFSPSDAVPPELRISENTGSLFNATRPSVAWNGTELLTTWFDLRNQPEGVCVTNQCQVSHQQQRLSSTAQLLGPNERLWGNLDLGLAAPLVTASEQGVGFLLFSRQGPQFRQAQLGVRLTIDENLWVKESPERRLALNTQPVLGEGALGRVDGSLMAAWSEEDSLGESDYLVRSIPGRDPNESVVVIASENSKPYSSGALVQIGDVVYSGFLGRLSSDAGGYYNGGEVYLTAFDPAGSVVLPPVKVNQDLTVPSVWSDMTLAAENGQIAALYGRLSGWAVRRLNLDGTGVGDEQQLKGDGCGETNDIQTAAIAALPDRYPVTYLRRAGNGDLAQARLWFISRATGACLGSPIVLNDPTKKATAVALTRFGDRVAVLFSQEPLIQGPGQGPELKFQVFDGQGNAVLASPRTVDASSPDTSFERLAISFTGHALLAAWVLDDSHSGVDLSRWQLLDIEGEPISPPSPLGFYEQSTGLSGQSDGLRVGFGTTVETPLGTTDLLLETYLPPSIAYSATLYNTAPTIVDGNVQDPNRTDAYAIELGQGVLLQASATSGSTGEDPGDAVVEYAWDLDGGGADFTGDNVTLTADDLVRYGIGTSGSFPIALTVTDSQGQTTTLNLTLLLLDVMPPVVTLISPNGGESWPVGASRVITWEASDDVGVDHFDLEYSTDFGSATPTWSAIATVSGQNSAYTWAKVPQILSATVRIRVTAYDGADELTSNSASDISDQNFYFIQATTSAVRTVILAHLGRMEARYPGTSGALLSKLLELAGQESVSGVVLPLDNVPAIDTALDAWDVALDSDPATSNDEALAAAQAIHDYLWDAADGQVSTLFTQTKYLVLVGEDAVLPFYRIVDSTGILPESTYTDVSASSSVGAALRATAGAAGGHFLSDDYYAAAAPQATLIGTQSLWLPTLAVGRLIQTPDEIEAQINRYIAQAGELNASQALVTGYDFLIDGAEDIVQRLTRVTVDDDLIDDQWAAADLRCRMLGENGCSTRPHLLSINGHANHYQLGTAQDALGVEELDSATETLPGAVAWGMGCHSGLVVQESETLALDVPQALSRLGLVAQIGQTGFGWGFRTGVGLTESLMRGFSEQLMSAPSVVVGDSLVTAKRAYYLTAYRYDVFDEKVLQQATLYGLPMYRVVTGQNRPVRTTPLFSATEKDGLSRKNGIGVRKATRTVPGGVTALELNFEFGAETLQRFDTEDGSYYELNGLTTSEIGNPLEPMFNYDSTLSNTRFRGVLFTGGTYTQQTGFNPVVGVPQSSNPDNGEGPLPSQAFWMPSYLQGQTGGSGNRGSQTGEAGEARLTVSVGHYLGSGLHRLFNGMSFMAYYSNSTDASPPVITDPGTSAVLHTRDGDSVRFEVQTQDNTGVFRVLVTYNDLQGQWSSLDLTPQSAGSTQWSGQVQGLQEAIYLVQAVDLAGNSAYLAEITQDQDAQGEEWGTETAGPRLFTVEMGGSATPSPTRTASPTATPTSSPSVQLVPASGNGLWNPVFWVLLALAWLAGPRRSRQGAGGAGLLLDRPETDRT